MNRRQFLQDASTLVAYGAVAGRNAAAQALRSLPWRTFDLTTSVRLTPSDEVTRVWIPLPLPHNTPFQQPCGETVHCTGGQWRVEADPEHALRMVVAEFPRSTEPRLTVVSRVQLRDWTVNLQDPARTRPLSAAERRAYLAPTDHVPTDGIVRSKALQITQGATTDEDRARAIYEWMVTHTYRRADVRGCGRGDIRPLLETGDLGGKCADLSALYVGLARAAGVPARDVYGIRVAPSRRGYSSLGPATGLVSRAQHCRAEVWLERFGWVPLDPADVRKVMLEEPLGNLPLASEKVEQARQQMFGSWEMNWIAFNYGQDVRLPGSKGPTLPFLMYPQAETAGVRLDSLNPDAFRYQVAATEV